MAGFINVPLLSTFNDAGIRKAQAQLGGISGAIAGIGRSVVAATAGFVGINAAIDFIGSSVTQARDAERNFAALGSVFDELGPQMKEFANNANSIGLSNVDAAKASTFLGSVLKQAGFDMDFVAGQTQNLVGLASDLAITYGYDVSEALTGMTALFRGEYDPIEKFGVAMKQSEVNAVLASNGQDKLTGAARRNAEQMARLALLYQRTQDAQGAYARGAGTLFVEQTNLATAMADMKQSLGEQLIPAFAAVATAMVPLVTNMGPALAAIFKEIAGIIEVLAPSLDPASQGMQQFASVMATLLSILKTILPFIIENIAQILISITVYTTLKNVILAVVTGLKVYQATTVAATAASAGLGATLTATPWGAIATGIAAIAVVGYNIADAMHKAYLETEGVREATELLADSATVGGSIVGAGRAAQGGAFVNRNNAEAKALAAKNKELAALSKAQKEYGQAFLASNGPATKAANDYQKMMEDVLKNFSGNVTELDKAGGKTKKAATDYIKKFYDGLKEETAKQRVRLQLEGKASTGLIDYILGSENWMTVWTSIKKDLDGNLKSLESQFKNTAAGVAEMAAAEKEAADKAQELQDKLQAVKDSLNSAASGFRNIGKESNLGSFEQEIVSALDSIQTALKEAFDAEDITATAFNDLKAYATKESAVLRGIAKQRDEIAKKRSLVEGILSSVKSSFYSAANITAKLDSITETVTNTSVKMIDGLRVTTTSTQEITKQTGSIVDNFKLMIDRTKTFVNALKQLKAQGLNAEAFQQIVDAGVESGTATAEGILAGGPSAVKEVNALFEDLRTVTGDAVDVTAGVMLAAGKEVTSSLLEGIKAEEYRLQELAASMAQSFADAFAAAVALAMKGIAVPAVASKSDMTAAQWQMQMDAAFKDVPNPAGWNAQTGGSFSTGRGLVGAPITVNVNAGLVSSPAQVGAEITSALDAYKRANGEI